VMYRGQVVETGPAELVRSRPRHPYTKSLHDAIPADHPARRRLAAPAGGGTDKAWDGTDTACDDPDTTRPAGRPSAAVSPWAGRRSWGARRSPARDAEAADRPRAAGRPRAARWPWAAGRSGTRVRALAEDEPGAAGRPGTEGEPGAADAGSCVFAGRCPRAQARCHAERPPLVTEPDGRSHACFFPLADEGEPGS